LHYLRQADELAKQPEPRIYFNDHDQLDRSGGPGGLQADASPHDHREHLLDVSSVVAAGELQLSWQYSDQVHDGATARRLADGMLQALREIIEHCAQPGAGGCTPSDFPLAKLTREQVDRIAGDGRSVEDIYPLTPLQ